MKVLTINATPKTDGLCYSFVTAAKEATDKLGIENEILRLSDIGIEKCVMCDDGWGICFRHHTCKFGDKDGFNPLQEKVKEADAYIYITPVYWGEVSEELKAFLDKLRRCQATKQWNSDKSEVSFLKGKPSIMVASAGGGGGGIVTTFADIERAITQMGGDEWPRETSGIFDYIAVNRWNQEYKREALKSAIVEMVKFHKKPKVVSVVAQADYKLLLTFDNEEKRIFDMKPYLEKKPYDELKDVSKFENVKITGVHIEWRSRVDMHSDKLYSDSLPI
ncbi:MAG: NAD(P)H-dependent oxidoreductase [Defluviitaleaceae bacterium]|nr:NAD(P)H-dependent oxidoreductase [Defluviitaleaceae bacterium]